LVDAGIDKNGYMEYRTADGIKVTEGAHNARVESSDAGPESIRYPNGDRRSFVRQEGSEQLQAVTFYSRADNLTREYTRAGVGDEWNYKVVDGSGTVAQVGVWKGAMEFRDGLFSAKGQGVKAPDGFWHQRDAAGKEFIERQNPDGSRQRFDAKTMAVTNVYRADGSAVACQYDNGTLHHVRNTDRDGKETNWSYNAAQQKWVADSADIAASANAPVDAQGQLVYRTNDQAAVKIFLDGSQEIGVAGGARIEVNQQGVASKTIQRNGDYRTLLYEEGKLTGYVDFSKDGKEKQRVSGLENLTVSPLGDAEYTKDGVRYVDRADMSRVEFDANDPQLIKRVTSPNGSYREFIYNDNKDLVKIDDVTKGKSGEKHALWIRRENVKAPFGPGGLSDSFERIDLKTNRVVDTRNDVQVNSFGDYSYLDGRGRERLAKASGRFSGIGDDMSSATIDDAHAQLVDTVAARFNDQKRTDAFEQMMKGFERRMRDTIVRRTAIGEDEEKIAEEVEKEVAMAYDNMARMLEPDHQGTTFDDPARRAQLAEALMYLLWEPQTAKQGGRNSCWFMSQWNEDVARHPGTFSKIFADVSLTGQCQDRQGKSYSFTQRDLAQTEQRHGVGWSIRKAGADDQTSPAVDRMERVLLVIGGWSPYRWHSGGGAQNARNALEKVISVPIGFIGGQFPSTRADRLAMMREGGAVKSGGPGHLNNMFVRAIRLDALGRVMQERAENRRNNRNGGLVVADVNSPEEEADDGSRVVFGIFRGDQYERDKLVAVVKDPKAFVETGEMAPVELHYPAPQLGKEFQVADTFKPSDFKPGRDSRNFDSNRPWRRPGLFRRS
jgi:hypothetical protein